MRYACAGVNFVAASINVAAPFCRTGSSRARQDPRDLRPATHDRADPRRHEPETTKYRTLPILLLAGGAGLAAVVVVYLTAIRLTDDRQRLRIDRLTAKG